jgi:hypothetical protein
VQEYRRNSVIETDTGERNNMIIFDNRTQLVLGLIGLYLLGYLIGYITGYDPETIGWMFYVICFMTGCLIYIFYKWIASGFDLMVSRREYIELLEDKRKFTEMFNDELQDYIFMTGIIPYDRYPPNVYNEIKARVDKKIAEGYYGTTKETKDEKTTT